MGNEQGVVDHESGSRRLGKWTAGELIIVVLLLILAGAIVLGMLLPSVLSPRRNPQIDATLGNLNNLKNALQMFEVDIGRYPTGGEGLDVLVHRPVGLANWHQVLDKVPVDGWGRGFIYRASGAGPAGYELHSVGADGVDGTADDISVKDN